MTDSGDDLTPQQARTLLKVLPIALIVGIGLAAAGLYLVRFHVTLALHGASATGEVIELEPSTSTSASGQATFFPIVTFLTPVGQQVTFRHRTGQRPPAYSVGEKVPVTYLPDQPDRALIAEGFLNWLLPGVLILTGPVLAWLSLRGIRWARRALPD
ncbi:MAG TPA: DUF3592 domain-containing protein [Thermohalobaculum sp.]|nr:DUF3592 domain-containing protein [Thermohalobaculum sp.]